MAVLTTLVSKPLTNTAYGFPRGATRRLKPKVLACIHITDNPNNQGPNAATNERDYANRAGSNGPSAHIYLNRDGSGVIAIDPMQFAAWSNGDLNKPNLANKGAAYLASLPASGHNANEGCVLEIENVGYDAIAGQITTEQMDTMARLLAKYSNLSGIHIGRDTVIPHSYVDSVNRPNCAWLSAIRETRLNQLVAEALTYQKAAATVQSFTLLPGPSGSIVVNGDNHAYLRLADNVLHPIPNGATKPLAYPVKLLVPIPGGAAGADRQTGYLIGDEAAFLLKSDVTFTPFPPADTTHTVTVAVDGATKATITV